MSTSSSFPSATTQPPLIVLNTKVDITSSDKHARCYIGPQWYIVGPTSMYYRSTWAQRTAPLFPGQIIKTASELGLDDAFVLAIEDAFGRTVRGGRVSPSASDQKIMTEDYMAVTRTICAWYRRRAALVAWAAQNRA